MITALHPRDVLHVQAPKNWDKAAYQLSPNLLKWELHALGVTILWYELAMKLGYFFK